MIIIIINRSIDIYLSINQFVWQLIIIHIYIHIQEPERLRHPGHGGRVRGGDDPTRRPRIQAGRSYGTQTEHRLQRRRELLSRERGVGYDKNTCKSYKVVTSAMIALLFRPFRVISHRIRHGNTQRSYLIYVCHHELIWHSL